MADDFGDIEDFNTGGAFFKPKDRASAVAILMEPIRYAHQVPNGFQGQIINELTANFWVFNTPASVEEGVPSVELLNATTDAAGVVSRGKAILAKEGTSVVPFRLEKTNLRNGKTMWALLPPDPDLLPKLKEFWDKRKGAADAAADRMAALLG